MTDPQAPDLIDRVRQHLLDTAQTYETADNIDELLERLLPALSVPPPLTAPAPLTEDPWHKLYRRAINEANGLTNYVEDRPELRSAERRLTAIEAEARMLAAALTAQQGEQS